MSTASSVGCPRLIGSPTARRGSPRPPPSAPSPPRPTARGGGDRPAWRTSPSTSPPTAPRHHRAAAHVVRPLHPSRRRVAVRRPPPPPTTYGQPEAPHGQQFGDRSAEIAAAAAAVAWDEDRAGSCAPSAPPTLRRVGGGPMCTLHTDLSPILAEGALPATLASLPASQILLCWRSRAVCARRRPRRRRRTAEGARRPRGSMRCWRAATRPSCSRRRWRPRAATARRPTAGTWRARRCARTSTQAAAQAARAVGSTRSRTPPSQGVERKWAAASSAPCANDESLTELRLGGARQPTAAEHAGRWSTRSRRRQRRRRRAATTACTARRRRPEFLRPCVAQRRAAAASAQRAIVTQLLEALAERAVVRICRTRRPRPDDTDAGALVEACLESRALTSVQLPVEARAESSQAPQTARPPTHLLVRSQPRATARI